MGAWGPGIFSDDTASDVRADYRALLEDQVPDDEATRQVIASYADLDGDEEHVLWLALASAQWSCGRLDADVKARALEIIDAGRGLELWAEAGAATLARRRAALAKLRDQLLGPQPARQTVRRPWRHETDLRPGDVLSHTTPSGTMSLVRVLRVDDHRVGAAPVVEALDWTGTSLPSDRRTGRLKPRRRPGELGGAAHPALYLVTRFRKKDADWRDSGFRLVAQIPARPEDRAAAPWVYLGWRLLADELERHVTS